MAELNNLIAIMAKTTADYAKALALSEALGIPLVHTKDENLGILQVSQEHLALGHSNLKQVKPYFVDLKLAQVRKRLLNTSIKQDILAKACQIKGQGRSKTVLDATAGFGRDALVLASFGCQISLMEQSSVLCAMLHDLQQRLQLDPDLQFIAANINSIVHARTDIWLQNNPSSFDIIYLDPMFPASNKAALVKKDMQVLQQIIACDLDPINLLNIARRSALERVVVKRPPNSDYLGNMQPHFSFREKSLRMDVYLT